MKNLDFTTAYMMKKNLMESASEVSYDMNTNQLIFWECEAPTLVCSFERAISGSASWMFDYCKKDLRDMFPHCMLEIKPLNGTEFIRIG